MFGYLIFKNNFTLRIQYIFVFITYCFLLTNCEDLKTLPCLYPRLYIMQNGNNLLVCKEGIHIYNQNYDLSHELFFNPFNVEISDNNEAEFINISQYPNNGYIIITTKNKFYFLSSEGQKIFDDDISFNNDGTIGEYFTLVPYIFEDNFNFITGYINTDKYFEIIYYKINISRQKIEKIKEFVPEIKNILGYRQGNLYNGFDCQMMHSDFKGDVLTCFHFDIYPGEIGAFSLYLKSSDIELIEDLCSLHTITNIQPKYLKSVTSPDKSKALIVFSDMISKGYYMYYEINSKEFSSEEQYSNINVFNPSAIQVQYFSQTHEYIF